RRFGACRRRDGVVARCRPGRDLAARRDRLRVPGLPPVAAPRCRAQRRSSVAAQWARRRRSARAGDGDARARGPRRTRARVAARTVGRRTAARRTGARAGARSATGPRRRAHRQPRSGDGHPGAGADRRTRRRQRRGARAGHALGAGRRPRPPSPSTRRARPDAARRAAAVSARPVPRKRAIDGRFALLGWLWRAQVRAQPGRAMTAVVAIAIGVALALAIHLVNRSAVAEFATAMSTVNGDAQAHVRARAGSLDERLYETLSADPAGATVSPVIEADFALADRHRESLRVVGIDVFRAAAVTPALVPSVSASEDAGAGSPLFADDTVFLSNAALSSTGLSEGDTLRLRVGTGVVALRIAGRLPGVPAGQRLAVMDLGAMQWRLGWLGRLTRLDLRFAPGTDLAQVRSRWEKVLPPDAMWSGPDASRQRMTNLSRAYRVNLSMLALIALFTGGFIVYATPALAVARQQRELALLGVLGARPRLLAAQVLGQGLLLGAAGAATGTVGGLAMASALLSWVGGDLGGGYFAGSRPTLSVDAASLLAFAAAGILTAL